MKINNKILYIIIILLLVLVTIIFNKGNKEQEYKDFNKVLIDSVRVFRDKSNRQVAKIKSFESENIKFFTQIKTKDSQILELQETIKSNKKYIKNQGSITNFVTLTKIDTVIKTKIIYQNSDTTNPIYTSKFDLNGWAKGTIEARFDKTLLDLQIKNKYSLVVGKEPQGLFKKTVPFAMVTNHNPYTETTEMRTYQVKLPKPKKWCIGPFAGYNGKVIVGIGVGYILVRL
jgi:hypothetical protein